MAIKIFKNRKHKRIFFWLFLFLSDTAAQLLIKVGAVKISRIDWINPWLVVGYSMHILSFVAWMQILRTTRLSIALAMTSFLYITLSVTSHIFLGETITIPLVVGTFFIAIGVFILGFNEGKKDEAAENEKAAEHGGL
jgi:drug/metabolite transporter (DMT)-like permease